MEHFRSRRMKAAAWALGNPVLQSCELGFETDTHRAKVGNGSDPWTSLPYMDEVSAGTVQKIEYDTFRLATAPYTLTASRFFAGVAVRQGNDIALNYARYANCLWDIWEVGGTGQWSGLTFDSAFDLYQFLDTNCEHNPGDPTRYRYSIMGRLYDLVDTSVPMINKVWGINTFLSVLKDAKAYKKNTVVTATAAWPQFATWFNTLASLKVGLPPGLVYSPNAERLLWLSRTYRTLYHMPHTGFTLGPGSMTLPRSLYDWDLPGIVPYGGGAVAHETVVPPGDVSMAWSFLRAQGGTTWVNAPSPISAMEMSLDPGYSGIVMYRMKHMTENKRVLFVKPLGVDRLGMNWFDSALYTLYAMYEMEDRTVRIKPITGFGSQLSDLYWVYKSQWHPYPWYSAARLSWRSANKMPSVKFFLRSNSSGRISPPSAMKLKGYLGEHNAPLKWMVEGSDQ